MEHLGPGFLKENHFFFYAVLFSNLPYLHILTFHLNLEMMFSFNFSWCCLLGIYNDVVTDLVTNFRHLGWEGILPTPSKCHCHQSPTKGWGVSNQGKFTVNCLGW